MSVLKIKDANGNWQDIPAIKGAKGDTGNAGQNGITPTIGDNGNWYLGETDTGKPSRGIQGETGQTGPAGQDGMDGRDGVIQYTAGDNITIENNIISASGGYDSFIVVNYQDTSDNLKAKFSKLITKNVGGRISAIITSTPYVLQASIVASQTTYSFRPSLLLATYSTTANQRTMFYFNVVGTWDENNNFTCTNITYDSSNYLDYSPLKYGLAVNNTDSYTPTGNYNPCTKLYADTVSSPIVTTSNTSTYTIASLTGNNVYKLGEITALEITAVTTFDKESVIYFTSGTTATEVSLPSSITNLGDAPTMTETSGVNSGTCTASKNYIIAIQNNIAVWKEY